MRWSGFRSLLLVALAAAAPAGCASNAATGPTPPPVLTTETFTGTLTPATTSYVTLIAKAGQVTVTLKTLSPDTTLKLSMSVGVYSPLYLTCTPTVSNASIGMGGTLIGLATATTSLCIALSDPGVIPVGGTEDFTITAEHY